MKESTLIQMKNQIEVMGQAIQRLMFEVENLKTLAIGTTELVKLFPDYENALTKLKENNGKEDTNGTVTGTSGSTDSGLELE